jgi:hypothetical protein
MTTALPLPICPAARTLHDGMDALAPESAATALRQSATELLRRKPNLIRDRIRFLTSHDDHLERMAAHSYWHSNGFAKIRFFRGTNFGVRLHIWPKGHDRLGDVDPHGHRWAFASWIAAGEGVEETTFVDVTGRWRDAVYDTTAYTRYDYGRDTATGWLREPEPARLRVSGTRWHHGGDVYGCSPTTLHVVAPLGDALAATVVLQGPVTEASAPVYSRRGRPSVTEERAISVAALRNLLRDVETALRRTEPVLLRYPNRPIEQRTVRRISRRSSVSRPG